MAKLQSVNGVQLSRRSASIAAAVLLVVMAGLLVGSAHQESQTFDEANHLAAGFMYLKHGDFSRNPEHPPLVKMLAAMPLLGMGLTEPPPNHTPYFKGSDSTFGTDLLYERGPHWESILMRGRMVIVLFTLGLGLLIFLATQEVFGSLAGVFALGLYVSQPLILGNGNIITTDVALACLMFATVYGFYRFCRRPTGARFAVCAVATCLTIVCKHSGVLVLPVLFLAAVADVLVPVGDEAGSRGERVRRDGLAFCALVVLGYVGIWGIYGFSFNELHIIPPIGAYGVEIAPFRRNLILFCYQHHLFPAPYLYGWVDILRIPSTRPSFLLGHIFYTSRWFFFPVAFVIKTTVALLVLLLLVPFVRWGDRRRAILFFALPAATFFLICIASMMNGGSRYLTPMYPYCIVVAGAAAGVLFERSSGWRIAVSALLVWGFVSTLHGYPDFLAYSNELFGGPARTYRSLVDPDVDWGQGLKWTSAYLAEHPDPKCWFDYWGNPGIDFDNFHVPCKQLLSSFGHIIGEPTAPIPSTIAGTILVSTSDIDGPYSGPGDLNPYAVFRDRKPDAEIGDIILVYHGTFDVPLLAGLTNSTEAVAMLRRGRLPEAYALAQAAVQQAPMSADVQDTYGEIAMASGHVAEGKQALSTALSLAKADYPEFQKELIDSLEHPGPHP